MTVRTEHLLAAAARRLERPAELVLSAGPVRRRLRRRALRAWEASEAPLFLCYGNVNRSAFAEALVRDRTEKRPASAGFYDVPDRPSSENAIASAAALGVDLASHRSTVATSEQLSGADAIFVFDLENAVQVALRNPRALRRTHLVGSLDGGRPVLIRDPHGRGPDEPARTFARIARAVWSAGASDGGRL